MIDESFGDAARSAELRTPLGPFEAFDRALTVQTDDPRLDDLIRDLFGDLRAGRDGGRDAASGTRFVIHASRPGSRGTVHQDGERLVATASRPQLLGTLIWAVNRYVLDEPTHGHLLLHAGGVASRDGRAVVLPGASGAGKSTLTAALLGRGFHYLSDEAIAIDGRAISEGYPKPLSIDDGAWPVLPHLAPGSDDPIAQYVSRQWHIRASRLAPVTRTGPVVALIFPNYEPGAQSTLRPLSPAEALVQTASATFPDRKGEPLRHDHLERLASICEQVPAYHLILDDLERAVSVIAELLEGAATDRRPGGQQPV